MGDLTYKREKNKKQRWRPVSLKKRGEAPQVEIYRIGLKSTTSSPGCQGTLYDRNSTIVLGVGFAGCIRID